MCTYIFYLCSRKASYFNYNRIYEQPIINKKIPSARNMYTIQEDTWLTFCTHQVLFQNLVL